MFRTRQSIGVVVASVLFGVVLEADAASMVQRSPHTGPSTVQTLLGPGLQSLNLDGTPFVSSGGVTAISKAQADDGSGVMKVYTEIDSRSVSGVPDMLIGMALAQTHAQAVLVGAGSAPVDVTFQLSFDGAFHTYSGNVFHQLGASLTVALPSSLVAFTNVEYATRMDFRTDLLDASAINVFGSNTKTYFDPGFQQVVETYSGGSYAVVSQTMENVAGMLQLSMSLMPGQSFQLIGNTLAQVNPEPLIPVTRPLDYSQSWGAVDGFNTGRLGIVLPAGYTLEGDAGMLTVAVVPEPGTWAMFLAGVILLWSAGIRRDRRHPALIRSVRGK
jgi:hypothetical protein